MGFARELRAYRATVVAGIVVILVVAAAFLALRPERATGELCAYVHDADGNVIELPLDEDRTIEVETSLGANVVVVENGSVRISEANCPGRDCTRQHAISKPGEQLICLPHELWVEVRAANAPQGEMDVDSVVWDDAGVDAVAR